MSKRIMIIEDDNAIAGLLENALELGGYTSTRATDGQDALTQLRQESKLPDLLIVDITMPVMDGLEFRIKQQEDETLRKIPIIFLTASNIERVELMKYEPFECLVKPIDLYDLLAVVKNFFLIA